MVRHIIIWTLNEGMTDEEKTKALLKAKRGLEGLKNRIEGLESIKVHIDILDSSNGDMMLESAFTDEAALKAYQTHPDHLEVAKYVKSITSDRKCIDLLI